MYFDSHLSEIPAFARMLEALKPRMQTLHPATRFTTCFRFQAAGRLRSTYAPIHAVRLSSTQNCDRDALEPQSRRTATSRGGCARRIQRLIPWRCDVPARPVTPTRKAPMNNQSGMTAHVEVSGCLLVVAGA